MKGFKSLPCLYTITHIPTGYFYIGSTINISRRMVEHRKGFKAQNHENRILRSLNASLDDLDFTFVITDTVELAREGEQELLDMYVGHPLCCNVGTGAYSVWKTGTQPDYAKEVTRSRSIGNSYSALSNYTMTEKHRLAIKKGHLGIKISREALVSLRKHREEKSKSVCIEGVIYNSASVAAKALGISACTVRRRIFSFSIAFNKWNYV